MKKVPDVSLDAIYAFMGNFLGGVVRGIVDHPNEVEIRVDVWPRSIWMFIIVNDEDIRQVVGKKGQMIKAILTLMNGCTAKMFKRSATVQVCQPGEQHLAVTMPVGYRAKDLRVVAAVPAQKEMDLKDPVKAAQVRRPERTLYPWEAVLLPAGSLAKIPSAALRVIEVVAEVCEVDQCDLASAETRGKQRVSRARQLAMYILDQWQFGSFSEIAAQFNRREHGTVLHAGRKIRALVKEDGPTRQSLIRCLKELAAMVPKDEVAQVSAVG